jgi:hypothetical protein
MTADPSTEALAAVLEATTVDADEAVVSDRGLLDVLELAAERMRAGDVWRALLDRFVPPDPAGEWSGALEGILARGPLARRIVRAVQGNEAGIGRARLAAIYGALCVCLERNEPFVGTGEGFA